MAAKKKGKKRFTGSVEQKSTELNYFNDGHRRIDYVLAYQPDSNFKKRAEMVRFRQKFEAAMRRECLELEIEGKENSQDGKTAFVKGQFILFSLFRWNMKMLRYSSTNCIW